MQARSNRTENAPRGTPEGDPRSHLISGRVQKHTISGRGGGLEQGLHPSRSEDAVQNGTFIATW
ncbi:hypothetical protein FA13DRAFT_1725444 [Coprinellus micaceus]|uniref:Uncharacterized protein n=1 Tax=Coprinellus micaceus TaxID=71717 RepID=A0A4Y7TV94_COPMI|nr:hypothetical protein FA13DRAFT_1725444 [Coprinellus micaceus]